MPLNSIPATTNVQALEEKRAAAKGKALVDYAFWGGAVEGNAADLKRLAEPVSPASKHSSSPPALTNSQCWTKRGLREAMPVIALQACRCWFTRNCPMRFKYRSRAIRQYSNYLHSRPDEAELQAIRLLIKLVREYRCPVHIVHLATSHALPELRQARAEGLPITVETCPHYLYFSAESIPDGATQFKCAPPIRAEFQRQLLWQALRDGDIDMIATDHSPCTIDLKQLHYRRLSNRVGRHSVRFPGSLGYMDESAFGGNLHLAGRRLDV